VVDSSVLVATIDAYADPGALGEFRQKFFVALALAVIAAHDASATQRSIPNSSVDADRVLV
jgi:hypothetical protein